MIIGWASTSSFDVRCSKIGAPIKESPKQCDGPILYRPALAEPSRRAIWSGGPSLEWALEVSIHPAGTSPGRKPAPKPSSPAQVERLAPLGARFPPNQGHVALATSCNARLRRNSRCEGPQWHGDTDLDVRPSTNKSERRSLIQLAR